MTKFPALLVAVAVVFAATGAVGAADKPNASPQPPKLPDRAKVYPIWPAESGEVPKNPPPEKVMVGRKGNGSITRITNVTNPTIAVCPPADAKGPTPAVIVCPGGGYSILAWDLEGTEIVEWLNSIGITGVLLKYRVPRQRDAAFRDAQRTVSLVRSNAKEWKIIPNKIGILGFSAGGHLAARTSTNFTKRSYKPIDDADKASPRPDFTVLIYPAYMADQPKGPKKFNRDELPVGKDTPPAFLAVAAGDRWSIDSALYFIELRQAGVRGELHIFATGGHGCGLRPTKDTVTTWPARCEAWLRGMGIIPPKAE